MAKSAKLLGWAFLAYGIAIIVAGLVRVAMKQGEFAVLQMLSPFNVVNFLAMAVTLAPGICLITLGRRLEQHKNQQRG